jgi:hypothetical protein
MTYLVLSKDIYKFIHNSHHNVVHQKTVYYITKKIVRCSDKTFEVLFDSL